MLRYLDGYRRETVIAPLFKMLEALFDLFVPLVMADIIDHGIAAGDTRYILLRCGLLVLATPIYSWYCTPQMKAVLDRHYGLNKYYGKAKGSLWAGKHVAILATHGYEGEYAYGPFETGVQRLCEHSKLVYDGLYSVVDEDNLASFRTPEAIEGARAFARRLVEAVQVDRGGL